MSTKRIHSTWDLEVFTSRERNSFRMVNMHTEPPIATSWTGSPFEAARLLGDCLMGSVNFRHPDTNTEVSPS